MGKIEYFSKELRRRHVFTVAVLYIVAAWVSIQVVDLAMEAGYLRGWSLRNAWNAAFIGFPLALIVGWFYDISRDGIVRTAPAGADESFDKSLHRKDYVLLATLAAVWAVAYIYIHTPPAIDKSIAVLPFENRGHDPQGADLAFGVRLDLQTQLEKLQDIKVIAQPSVERIDKDLPIPVMAQKLGVAFIMKGTVERILDRVRVSVTLIDAERDEQAWSGSYDRVLEVGNLFDIRDDIASVITDRLQAVLSPQELERIRTRPTENLAALQAYYHGKQRMAKRTTGPLAEAVGYFQQAVDLDPEFALAYVGLADSYYLHMLYASLPEDEELPKMEAAIDRALELDDQLGEAYVTFGVLQWRKDDPVATEVAFKRALELNPNYPTAHQWYGTTLVNLGRAEEGLAHKRKAQELDPLSAIINLSLGMTLDGLGRFDEALAQYETVIEIDPAHAGGYERISEIYRYVFGQLDEAVAWQRKGIALDPSEPWGSIFLGVIYLDLGDSDQAEHWFNRSLELAPPGFPVSSMVMEPLYLYRGEEAKARDVAHKSLTFDPRFQYTLAHLRNHDLQAGRYAEARARYELGYPALLQEDEPTIDDRNYVSAIDLALVLTKTGEQERADLLLDRTLMFLPTIPRLGTDGYGISDVLIYALQGKPEAALTALRQAIDQGWRTAWWFYLERDPNLDSIRDEPEFQAMLEEIKADMAAQLERVREMEASGELEPIPDVN